MAEEALADSPELALDRIEAALTRIASGAPGALVANPGLHPSLDPSIIAERLDGLIARLRDALASVAD